MIRDGKKRPPPRHMTMDLHWRKREDLINFQKKREREVSYKQSRIRISFAFSEAILEADSISEMASQS